MMQNKSDNRKACDAVDLLDVLLDQDNCEPITLTNPTGREIDFEQIAVIPHNVGDERFLFVILKPLDKIPGIDDDEAIVFRAASDNLGNTILTAEEDELIAIDVFNKYYDLLEEEAKQKSKGGKK